MNLVARQNFSHKASIGWNTYIGGVSASITTASVLATKLGISVGNISNFTIVGSDIKCRITGSYALPDTAFSFATTPCTYYIDSDFLVTSIGLEEFYATDNFENLDANFENATTVAQSAFRRTRAKNYLLKNATTIGNLCFAKLVNTDLYTESIYIPNATTLGTTSGNNQVFEYIRGGSVIYAHPSLATNNSGAPDGDLAYAITQGAIVRYVTSFVAPSAVTDLAAGTIYNTAIQLNFTPPSATNTIEWYECYADGVFKNRISGSGGYIKDLIASTSYNITVYAVDIFRNKSLVSNVVTQSTNTTSYLAATTIAAYHLTSDGVDSKNAYNGTVGGGVSFSSGAVFTNVSNSNIIVADNNAFSFGNGTNDLPFSVSFKINFSGTGDQMIANKRNNTVAGDEWQVLYYGGKIGLWLVSNGSSTYINSEYTVIPTIGVDYDFAFTYTGGGAFGIKIYMDGVLRRLTPTTVGTYTKMPNGTAPVTIGAGGWDLTFARLTAKLKELNFFNTELTPTEVNFIQTNNYPF